MPDSPEWELGQSDTEGSDSPGLNRGQSGSVSSDSPTQRCGQSGGKPGRAAVTLEKLRPATADSPGGKADRPSSKNRKTHSKTLLLFADQKKHNGQSGWKLRTVRRQNSGTQAKQRRTVRGLHRTVRRLWTHSAGYGGLSDRGKRTVRACVPRGDRNRPSQPRHTNCPPWEAGLSEPLETEQRKGDFRIASPKIQPGINQIDTNCHKN
jgi:hypothetical protein